MIILKKLFRYKFIKKISKSQFSTYEFVDMNDGYYTANINPALKKRT